jgi:hypothetical protein
VLRVDAGLEDRGIAGEGVHGLEFRRHVDGRATANSKILGMRGVG